MPGVLLARRYTFNLKEFVVRLMHIEPDSDMPKLSSTDGESRVEFGEHIAGAHTKPNLYFLSC